MRTKAIREAFGYSALLTCLAAIALLTVLGSFFASVMIHEWMHVRDFGGFDSTAVCWFYGEDLAFVTTEDLRQSRKNDAALARHFEIYWIQGIAFGWLSLMSALVVAEVGRIAIRKSRIERRRREKEAEGRYQRGIGRDQVRAKLLAG